MIYKWIIAIILLLITIWNSHRLEKFMIFFYQLLFFGARTIIQYYSVYNSNAFPEYLKVDHIHKSLYFNILMVIIITNFLIFMIISIEDKELKKNLLYLPFYSIVGLIIVNYFI